MITFSHLGNYGRFGNQLWQIASTIGVATKNGHEFTFPHWKYQEYFKNKLPETYIKTDMDYYEGTDNPYYRDVILDRNVNYDLIGYFQSWKYFEHCKDLIYKYFSFPKLSLKGVAVHVRRGDYLSLQHIHPVLSLEYYKEAFKLFKGETFTIISDDMDWCKNNFVGDKFQFYQFNSDWEAFSWMASYDKFIIANSSFSFWAAYLSESKNIVAPKVWVTTENHDDRVPPEWVRI